MALAEPGAGVASFLNHTQLGKVWGTRELPFKALRAVWRPSLDYTFPSMAADAPVSTCQCKLWECVSVYKKLRIHPRGEDGCSWLWSKATLLWFSQRSLPTTGDLPRLEAVTPNGAPEASQEFPLWLPLESHPDVKPWVLLTRPRLTA